MHARAAVVFALFALGGLPADAAQAPRWVGPRGERPPVLELLPPLAQPRALAVSADGSQMAVAEAAGGARRETTLTLYSVAEPAPTSVVVPGEIRDLLFSRDGATLFGVQHRQAAKSDGQTHLLRLELDTLEARQEMRLPASAATLDYWPEGDSLLVACDNEIRTILLAGLRSGQLYRVAGANLSVASIGASRVLVGQEGVLLLVDLDDPSDREGTPVREQLTLPAPAVSLAAAADGSTALVRLLDDRVLRVAFDPLALSEEGTARGLLRPGRAEAAPRPQRTSTPPPEPSAPPLAVEIMPERERDLKPEPARLAEPTRPAPPPQPPAPAPPPVQVAPGEQVAGRVVGLPAGVSVAVVLLGPNNVMREAARVGVGPDGRFSAQGLARGRYRLQLDAGGKRLLLTDPPVLVIEIGAEPLATPEIRVLRAL